MKILTFECNFVVAFIFKQWISLLFSRKSAFGLVMFFFKGRLFSLNGCLSLFNVKLCSAQKFIFGYNISYPLFNIYEYIKCK